MLNLSIGKPHIRKHLNQLFIFLHLQFEKLSANTSTAQLYLYLILIQSVIHISFITHINLLSAISEPNSLKKIISLSWRHHNFKYRSWNNEPKHHKVYLAAVLEPPIILRYLLLQIKQQVSYNCWCPNEKTESYSWKQQDSCWNYLVQRSFQSSVTYSQSFYQITN